MSAKALPAASSTTTKTIAGVRIATSLSPRPHVGQIRQVTTLPIDGKGLRGRRNGEGLHLMRFMTKHVATIACRGPKAFCA
jgi:hypothetical protein